MLVGIVSIIVVTVTFIFIKGKDNLASNKEDTSKNIAKHYELLEDLPRYNHYDDYELKEAVNQEWFSKIGKVGETRKPGLVTADYVYVDVTLGYDKKEKKEYLYPDTIVIQGRLDGRSGGYGQTIIIKDQYATKGGYQFIKNAYKIAGCSEEEINQMLENKLKITNENIEAESAIVNALDSSKTQEHVEAMRNGRHNWFQQALSWGGYDYLKASNFRMECNVWEVQNQMSRIIDYDLKIEGGCCDQYAQKDGSGKYRVIFVYDDLQVNVNIPYSKNDKVKYLANFLYNSEILDQEAYQAALKSYKK